MSIKCVSCGRFIGYAAMQSGRAAFEYTPDSEFTREVCDWRCAECEKRDADRLDDPLESLIVDEAHR